MDYYSILGLSKTATQDDIRKAYKKMSMKHHPDRGGDEEEFKKVNEAYQTLGDAQKRAAYDNPQPQGFNFNTQNMHDGFGPFGMPGMDDVFAQMFRQQRQPMQRNQDITIAADVTIADLFTGKQLYAQFSTRTGKQERVEIDIPKGIREGQSIRYKGLGDNSIPRLPRGDLYVKVRILPDRNWRKEGYDFHTTVDVNIFDLLLGGEVNLSTPEGRTLSLKIPKGSQPSTTFSVHGYGVPDIKSGRRGTIFVKLNAFVPRITDENIINDIERVKNATANLT